MRKLTIATAAAVTALSLAALGGSPAVAYPRPLDAELAATPDREDIQFPQRPDELQPPWTQGHPSDELQAPRAQAHPSDELQAPRTERPGDDTERPLTDEHQAPRA
jgi:hypothetical protein